jgi:uncharacterized protein
MNVVLYGATGNAGSRILEELIARGHGVVAVVRDTSKIPTGVKSVQDDLSNVDRIAEIIQQAGAKGADAIVSAYAPPQNDTDQLINVTEREIEAVRRASNVRLIVVGGAGSLEVAPGVTLLASGHLPEAWMPIATSHEKALKVLESSDINWTYFSPAAFFEAGSRTGKFRLGGRNLVADDQGQSRISFADYAIALVDELEKPAHERAQFSIGY